ncbi:MAG: hypothetical protein LIP09_12165 [Bacteroidales bacterium]|nr:hypothetical protein [Bacteroidales bacterium]
MDTPQLMPMGIQMDTNAFLQKKRELSAAMVSMPTNKPSTLVPLGVDIKAVNKVKATFGNGEIFLSTFHPSYQIDYYGLGDICFIDDDFPTLAISRWAFGSEIAQIWMVEQLYNFSEYIGCKDEGKLDVGQIHELGRLIRTKWGWLKVTEIMYFMVELKSHHYGPFYGWIDPLLFCGYLEKFLVERWNRIDKIERRKKAEAEDERMRQWKEHPEKFVNEYVKACIELGVNPYDYPPELPNREILNHLPLTKEEYDEMLKGKK